ncbi:MAG: D-tyrosyl-tRNA(Tyr) deacylase [Armatimonadota bacterium]
MRAIVQRVSEASVSVGGRIIAKIGPGLVLLVGVHREDQAADAQRLARRIANLRIIADAEGKMNLSLLDSPGQVLAVSNFTVFGEAGKSRRPSFTASAPYSEAETLFETFVAELRLAGLDVLTGEFGAMMEVALTNSGPVTLVVESH